MFASSGFSRFFNWSPRSWLAVHSSMVVIATAAPAHANGTRAAPALFTELCASCHGAALEGGQAPALRGEAQRLGEKVPALVATIRDGSANKQMPAFGGVLSEHEIQSLVVYVQELARRSVDEIPAASQALPNEVQSSEEHRYRFEVLVENRDVAWALTFLPGDRMLFTERRGELFSVSRHGGEPTKIEGVPEVLWDGEGGLFDVELAPDFDTSGWIYLSFADRGADYTSMTKVIRGRVRDNRWMDEETIFAAEPRAYTYESKNFGGRLLFDGPHLFFTVGEHGVLGAAQDLALPHGKVHRVLADGTIPADNPFATRTGALGSIWTLGHRNPQGLAQDPRTGVLWSTEHGPRGGDELNRLTCAHNYGWPLVTHGMNYDGTPVAAETEREGLEPPILNWTPSIAPCPIHFYTGNAFPRWRHSLFLGSLAQQELWRLVVEDNQLVHRELMFRKLGRIRDIATGPAGELYLSLEVPGAPGYIVRLVPDEPAR